MDETPEGQEALHILRDLQKLKKDQDEFHRQTFFRVRSLLLATEHQGIQLREERRRLRPAVTATVAPESDALAARERALELREAAVKEAEALVRAQTHDLQQRTASLKRRERELDEQQDWTKFRRFQDELRSLLQ